MCFATRKTAPLLVLILHRESQKTHSHLKRANRHSPGVETQQSTQNKGGRPPKEATERAIVKLNCWITTPEKERLNAEFIRVKGASQLCFAAFLKSKLFNSRVSSIHKETDLLLTMLISLQERGRQLSAIQEQLDTETSSEKGDELTGKLTTELAAIQQTLTQLSTWLYDS